MAPRPVDELRELDRLDTGLRARAERLRALDAEVAAVRAAAEAADAFFTAYPDEDTRLRGALAQAKDELARRHAEEADARAERDAARDDETRRLAERAVERAADHVTVAEARVARAQAAYDALEQQAAALPAELGALEAQARRLDGELPDVPSPDASPRSLVEWASRAHASIFVTTGSVDTQRERVIREANELASMLLGEPTYGSTVAQATARVEAALGGEDG